VVEVPSEARAAPHDSAHDIAVREVPHTASARPERAPEVAHAPLAAPTQGETAARPAASSSGPHVLIGGVLVPLPDVDLPGVPAQRGLRNRLALRSVALLLVLLIFVLLAYVGGR
jgi:hypothetical protein